MSEFEKAIQNCTNSLSEAITNFASAVGELVKDCTDILVHNFPQFIQAFTKGIISPRVIHLAKYSKKKRNRKKNQHRIQKEYKKFLKL